MIDFKNLNFRLLVSNIGILLVAFLFNDPFHFFESSYETSGKLIEARAISDFDQIKITGVNKAKIDLKKTDSGWNIIDLQKNLEYTADASKVNKSLERILEMRKYYEVTNNPEKYKEFGVDDASLLVEFIKKDTLYSLYIGNQGSSYNTTLVRLKNDNTVYSIRGNLITDWNQEIDYFRNKRIFSLTKENIKMVSTTGLRNLELQSEDNNIWHLKQGAIFLETDPTKINRYLDDIAMLEGISFYHGDQLGYNYGKIKVISKSNIEFNLEIRKVGNDFIMKSETNPYWQTIAEYRVNSLFPNRDELKSDSGTNN